MSLTTADILETFNVAGTGAAVAFTFPEGTSRAIIRAVTVATMDTGAGTTAVTVTSAFPIVLEDHNLGGKTVRFNTAVASTTSVICEKGKRI